MFKRGWPWVLFAAVVCQGNPPQAWSVPTREATQPAQFPEAVRVKTSQRSFNLFFYFALDGQGRIWVKSIPGASPETEKVAPDWQLFAGTGLPHDESRKDFVRPRRIESINADQDELMAVSDDHRHYSLRWFKNPVFKEETPAKVWADQHGWPVPGPFVWDARVARNRGWAVGRRTRNFAMFEDAAGRTFDGGGGLSTYYFLTADGTAIAFSDSGLPPDFSHTIGGPDRSTFVAEAMQVSADTIFLINAYGELRTRMVDFDTNGSDTMFFVYSYDRNDKRPDAIAIPAEDWFAHKPIPLWGQAQISTSIAIVLTGKHNRDRELRVAGFDRDRRPGYYHKRIFDQAEGSPVREDRDDWTFQIDASVALDPGRLLDPADTDPDAQRAASRAAVPAPRWQTEAKPPRRVAGRDLAFQGQLRVAGKVADVVVEVPDFHLDWSPARLRFLAGDDSIEVKLHTAEKWYHLQRFDPGHDGTPKEFQATLELPLEALATRNPALRKVVDEVLKPYQLAAFAFFAQATEDYLEIESKPKSGPPIALHLLRQGGAYPSLAVAKRDSLRQDTFTRAAHDPALQVDRPLAQVSAAEASLLSSKIDSNLRAAGELPKAAAAPERQDAATPKWLSPAVLGSLRFAARPWMIKVLMPALPFRNVSTAEAAYYARNLATNMPPLLSKSRELKGTLLSQARQDLAYALMVIDTRVAAYRLKLDELRRGKAGKPFVYFETLDGFWAPHRFGVRAAALVEPRGTAAPPCRFTVSDDPIFEPARRVRFIRRPAPPGFLVDVACGGKGEGKETDVQLGLRVTPTRLQSDFFQTSMGRADPVGSTANPLVTPVRIEVDHVGPAGGAQAVLDLIFRNKAAAASQEVPAQLSVQGGRFRLVGKGFTLEWWR